MMPARVNRRALRRRWRSLRRALLFTFASSNGGSSLASSQTSPAHTGLRANRRLLDAEEGE